MSPKLLPCLNLTRYCTIISHGQNSPLYVYFTLYDLGWCIKSTLCTRFRKNKVVNGKASFFVIVPFCTLHSICLNKATDRAVLYENFAFPVLVLSTKKPCSSFLKTVCVFQEICFVFLKRRAILKIPNTVFQRNLCSLCCL